jgi:hypothetical protein
MSICIDDNQITEEFLESLKAPEEKPVRPVTIDELAIACEKAFSLYAEPLKEYIEQDKKSQD